MSSPEAPSSVFDPTGGPVPPDGSMVPKVFSGPIVSSGPTISSGSPGGTAPQLPAGVRRKRPITKASQTPASVAASPYQVSAYCQ